MPSSFAHAHKTEDTEQGPEGDNDSQRRRSIPPPIAHLTEAKKLIPFGWYGGKFSHLDWLLPLLPDCHHYCEPFAGSGAVLLNRGPSPVETFNDLDGDVLRLYDSPGSLFYCDPPYVHSTRGDSKAYGFEMTDTQHSELAEILNSVQGMVAFSNYQAQILDHLYPAPKWHKTVSPARTNHSTKDKRIEVLWTNYDPHNVKGNGKVSNGELFSKFPGRAGSPRRPGTARRAAHPSIAT